MTNPLDKNIVSSVDAIDMVLGSIAKPIVEKTASTVVGNGNTVSGGLKLIGAGLAAKYAGIKITRATVVAMALSGALAGMAGANEVLGVNYRLLPAFSSGYGFDSIALALLGKTHPLGVILSSLLFGFLRNGARSMQLAVGVPIDIVSILQAVILAFIAAPAIIRTIYRLKEPKHQEELVSLRSWKG